MKVRWELFKIRSKDVYVQEDWLESGFKSAKMIMLPFEIWKRLTYFVLKYAKVGWNNMFSNQGGDSLLYSVQVFFSYIPTGIYLLDLF